MEASQQGPTQGQPQAQPPVTPANQTQQTQEAPASQDQPQTTDDLLRQIVAQQEAHRAEVAQLREEFAQDRENRQTVPVAAPSQPLSEEDALKARMEDVSNHDFYCPGCGLLYDYRQRCTGRAESPHSPIEVVSTDELKEGDESKYTKPEYV